VGRVGRKWGGRRGLDGPAAGKEKREVGWAAGREMGWVCFFPNPFSNLFQTLFKFKSFTSFQIQILTQISPTI
jgi:hypothetical protein